jgi:hypothetical protein
MSTKNLSRRQILASGAALAAPMLALTTPAHVHAGWDKCKSDNPNGPSFAEIINSITWGKEISNILGTKASIRFGKKSAQPGTYVQTKTFRTRKIGTIVSTALFYGVNSGTTSGQSYKLYNIDGGNCQSYLRTTLRKDRCLVLPDPDRNGDPWSENVGLDGVPSAPWLVNGGEPIIEEDDEERMEIPSANASGPFSSAHRYADLMGWMDYRIHNDLGLGLDFVRRRVWVWDPAISVYRVLDLVVGEIDLTNGNDAVNYTTTNFFQAVVMAASDTLTQRLNRIDWSDMPWVDPSELVTITVRDYGQAFWTDNYQIAAFASFGENAFSNFSTAVETHRHALNAIQQDLRARIWRPRSNVYLANPRPISPTSIGSGSTDSISSISHCSFNPGDEFNFNRRR